MDIGEGGITPVPVDARDVDQPNNINISDVFEAISIADPSFHTVEPAMYRNAVPEAAAPAQEMPYVRITEQPASKALRFRYECEGRSAGSIPGASSDATKKTFPSIEICGYRGRAVVVVSCVTKDRPYKPHPHNLVGRDLCKKGVATVNVTPEQCSKVTFSNLGIQCVKRKDIEAALTLRQQIRVDPFKTGFSHRSQPQGIDLNAVRLCFQVFIPDAEDKIRMALQPVVSDVIYDKKAMSDLMITRLSHASAPVTGGEKLIILCEKVAREDIGVNFFELSPDNQRVWMEPGTDLYVHKQVAICVTTPKYRDTHATEGVKIFLELVRLSDQTTSAPMAFELRPITADPNYLRRKRQRPLASLDSYLSSEHDMNFEAFAKVEQKTIKLEPRDKTPPHQLTSPPPSHHVYPSYDDRNRQYAWPADNMQGGLTVPGPSHMNYAQPDMTWNMGAVSPVAPSMGHISPNMGHISPRMGHVSPNMGHMSPNMGHVSPNMGHVSPNMGHVSPNMGQVSPNMGHVSPNMGHVSPNMNQMAPMMQQNMAQLQQDSLMETSGSDPPSITGLLQLDRGENDNIPQLNSSDLSGLSSLLADTERGTELLSDSLKVLNTGDLLPQRDLKLM